MLVATVFLKGMFLAVPVTATKLRFPEMSHIAALEKPTNKTYRRLERKLECFSSSSNFISCLCCFKTLYSDVTKEKRALVCEV
jgi:hypothetical protein